MLPAAHVCMIFLLRHGVIVGPFRVLSHTRMHKERTVRRIKRHALLAWEGVTQTASWIGCSTYGWEHCGQTSKHKGECCTRIDPIFGVSLCTLSPFVTMRVSHNDMDVEGTPTSRKSSSKGSRHQIWRSSRSRTRSTAGMQCTVCVAFEHRGESYRGCLRLLGD